MNTLRSQLRDHRLARDFLNLLYTPEVHLVLLQPLRVRLELGEGSDLGLLRFAHDEREAHQNVSSREFGATEILSTPGRAGKLRFEITEMSLEVRVEVQ